MHNLTAAEWPHRGMSPPPRARVSARGHLSHREQVHGDGITAQAHSDSVSSGSHAICGAPLRPPTTMPSPPPNCELTASAPDLSSQVLALLQPHEGQEGPGARSQALLLRFWLQGPWRHSGWPFGSKMTPGYVASSHCWLLTKVGQSW